MNKYAFFILSVLFSIFFVSNVSGQAFQKTFGSTGNEVAYSLYPTSDGGWVIAGYNTGTGPGGRNIYVLKLDPNYAVEWSKAYGGPNDDVANYIQQTSDGGYIIAGNTESFGVGGKDALAMKLDPIGNVIWTKTFGSFGEENFQSVVESRNGGFVFGGFTDSYGAGSFDYYVVKTNGSGTQQWAKTFGNSSWEYVNSIIQTNDDGYMAAGSNLSFGSGGYDNYLVKLDSSGNMQWNKTIGGTDHDGIRTVIQLPNDDYVMVGNSYSFAIGDRDVYLVRTNSVGTVLWSKTYGGTDDDHGWTVRATSDNGFICMGFTNTFGAGSYDIFVIKTDGTGVMEWTKTYGGQAYDDAWAVEEVQGGGYLIAGYTASFGAGSNDIYLIKLDPDGGVCCNSATSSALTTSPNSIATIPTPDVSSPSSSSVITVTTANATPQAQDYCFQPIADFESANTVNCENACIDFVDLSTGNPATWQWTFQGAVPVSSTNQNPANICYASSGNYTVSLIVNSGGCSDTMTKPNYIQIIDTCNSISASDTFICDENCVDFFALVPVAATGFQWSFPGGTPSSSTQRDPTNICYDNNGSFDVQLIYTISGITDTIFRNDYIVVSDFACPDTVRIFLSDSIICVGDCIDFTAQSAVTADSYQWQFPGGTPSTSNVEDPTGICYNTAGVYDVILIFSKGGLLDTVIKTAAVIVNSPAITATVSDTLVPRGTQVQLNVYGATQFSWRSSTPLSCDDCPDPTAIIDTTAYFFLEATDSNGCEFKDTLLVRVENDCENLIVVASGFSPNGDGNNEIIQPFFTSPAAGYKLMIFNRWGEVVFESENLYESWDGSYKGVVQDIQVFAYMLQYSCQGKDYLKSGNITLVR